MAEPASSRIVDSGGPRAVRAELLARRSLRGRRFCEAYTAALDEWIATLLPAALRETGHAADAAAALLAVGGYGRRELCPASDLDLVLIHDGVRGIDRIADALWYPLWETNVPVDHSVRTPKETLEVAGRDLKSALGLLTARGVGGDAELADRVAGEARRAWAARPRESLERLRAALEERWAQHGELAFLLEPDVKLTRGGLRDLEALHAAALAAPVARPFVEDPRLDEAADLLLSVRVALHATTERRSDQLLLADQDSVARRLGFADADELLPSLAAAARRIAWTTDLMWRRIDAWLAGPRPAARERTLEAGIALRGDELDLDETVDPAADSSLALRLAAASARTGVPLAGEALARLAEEATAPPEPWPRATLDALLDLLGCGHAAIPLLETLDHIGVLARYVREWPAVRSRPQRNVYHRFTVDRHLFEAAAEAAGLTRTVHRPDLLLVAAWLHDLGKGFPGDHSEAGALLAEPIARRMGFDAADASTLARLVRHHLLLADTATRRDLSDPATVEAVADRVGTIAELDLLAAITRADAVATGPGAWSGWKAALLDELVMRTRGHLAGQRHEPVGLEPTPAQRRLLAGGGPRVIVEGSRLTVVAPDRVGLLAIAAGVLAVNRLPVRAATGVSERAMALETFELDLSGRDAPDSLRLESDLVAALADPDALAARLAERSRSTRLPRRAGAARVADPRVLVDNEATPRSTILEVRAPDGPGLLSRVAWAIAGEGCDITLVRALTLGHEVVDTFYVREGASGAKLTDPARVAGVQTAVLAAIGAAGPSGSLGEPAS